MSTNGDACLAYEPGCIYTKGKCTKCSDPFVFNNGACFIEGCSVFNTTGCTACKTGYTLDSGKCLLPNCQRVGDGQCLACD